MAPPNESPGGKNHPGNAAGSDSLTVRTMHAASWRILSEASRFVLQFGVSIALARILPVEAFGLIAMALIVLDLGARLSDLGTTTAIIQRATITPTHVRVAFSLSVISGVLLTAAIWLGAPLAASAFNAGTVAPILIVIGWNFLVRSFGSTAEALMQRRMEYRRLLTVELVSYGFGFALPAIALALLHFGVWALVWAQLCQSAVKTLLLLRMNPHPARLSLARREAGELLNFGIGMTLSRLATCLAQKGDNFVVARWLGSEALGLYSRAYSLMLMPIYLFSSALNSVLFPVYSSIQDEPDRLRQGYLASLSLGSIVVFPVQATLAITAPELMTGLFGPQWAPAAVPLQWLCLTGAFFSMYNLADSLVKARGAVYAKFGAHAIYAVSVIVGAIAGSHWGIGGVAIGVGMANGVTYLLMACLSLRLTGCGWLAFFHAQLPGVVITGLVASIGVPAAIMLRAMDLPPLVVLAGVGGASCLTAIAATVALPKAWLPSPARSAFDLVSKRVLQVVAAAATRMGLRRAAAPTPRETESGQPVG